jgi:flagellar motor component MotA
MGLIAAGSLTDASFLRLVQVSAVLFIAGAAVCAVTITNPVAPAEPLPCEVAALCRDRARRPTRPCQQRQLNSSVSRTSLQWAVA